MIDKINNNKLAIGAGLLANPGQGTVALMKDMQATAARMRELIVGMPPEKLFGYIYVQLMMTLMQYGRGKEWIEFGIQSQFLLEYTHAVLATNLPPKKMTFSKEKCKELLNSAVICIERLCVMQQYHR